MGPLVLLIVSGCDDQPSPWIDADVAGDGDGDGDIDSDADIAGDADGDTDSDSDGDTHGDSDADNDGDLVPPPFEAIGYFVGTGGDDSAAGISHATRWATIDRVESADLPPGTDVWFLEDTVFEDQDLFLDWSGSPDDWVTLGSYYVDVDGNELQGYRSRRAEINGTYEASCSQALGGTGTCDMNVDTAVPSGAYRALITVDADYVQIQDLIVADSAGIGIQNHSGTSAEPVEHHHLTIENVFFNGAAMHCLLVSRLQHGVFRGNELTHCGLGCNWADNVYGGTSHPHAASVGRMHPAYTLFENNYIHETFTEGVNCIHGSYCIFRGNRVIAGNVCYYTDNAHHVVIEHNECFGRGPGFGFGKPNEGGSSTLVVVGVENNSPLTSSVGIIARNNRAAGVSTCFRAAVDRGPREEGVDVGAEIYGNTCIGVHQDVLTDYNNLSSSNLGPDGFEISNNIFSSLLNGPSACNLSSSGWDVHHNAWTVTQNDADCRSPGTGDVSGDPMLSADFDWANAGIGNFPLPSDWQVVSGSAPEGAGEVRTSETLNIDDWGGMFELFEPGDFNTCIPTEEQWEQELAVDFNCNARTGNTMGSEN